ncbi:ECF RNA polymerase sigma-E factor [bacterium HR17]|jgi:RNA polymerase sigma-70 factor (ECF subfamily)|uniref:ECF RNA polymerase sigma-E factor n=1 Tax=Candidatus Fervidibacter japonicus TaxID=2035412 RepID=A0A2H5XE21_9BACT|nr:ECF RNA polymerase sigma-E factor [bacterium HR17]
MPKPTALPDELLVQRAKAGDSSAFDQLVERHYQKVFALAFHLLGNADDAADATQEAFVRAFERLHQFRGDATFSTWLYRITVNICRDARRRFRPTPFSQLSEGDKDTLDAVLESADPDPAEEWQRRERREAVHRVLQRLPAEFQQVLVLCDLQGLTYAEVAAVLGVPEGTVKSRLHRARHAFKELWQQLHREQTFSPPRPKGGENQ